MPELVGSFLPVTLPDIGATFSADAAGTTRYFSINTESAVQMFENISVLQRDVQDNSLGLYSHVPVGRDLKARFGSLTTPAHIFSSAKKGCTWNPKGSIRLEINEYNTTPIEYNGEQCPDVFFETCLQRIFGTGNDVRDFLATPEGQRLLEQLINRVYIGLGNSYSEFVHYAQHPTITALNASGKYAATPDAWAAYYDQQTSPDSTVAGLVTLLDQLRDQGISGHDIDIPQSDFNAQGEYTGDIVALLNKLMLAAKYDFRQWIQYGLRSNGAGRLFPIIKLTDALYTAYEEYLLTTFSSLPQMYQYFLTLEDGTQQLMPGVLKFKNMPVTRWDEVGWFDNITGCTSHRAAIFAPGVLGISHDVDDLRQFSGMGLRMVQRLDAPWQGKVFMDTILRTGTGIANVEFVTQAARLIVPN